MDQIFNNYDMLFNQLNDWCNQHLDDDLSLVEDAMSELVNSWTDYMMSREVAPTDEESQMYHAALELVSRWE